MIASGGDHKSSLEETNSSNGSKAPAAPKANGSARSTTSGHSDKAKKPVANEVLKRPGNSQGKKNDDHATRRKLHIFFLALFILCLRQKQNDLW